MTPCSPGVSPVAIAVSAVAVVDGATVGMSPPAMAASVGAMWRRSWSCSQPSPSRTSSTTWRASAATAGSQEGVLGRRFEQRGHDVA